MTHAPAGAPAVVPKRMRATLGFGFGVLFIFWRYGVGLWEQGWTVTLSL